MIVDACSVILCTTYRLDGLQTRYTQFTLCSLWARMCLCHPHSPFFLTVCVLVLLGSMEPVGFGLHGPEVFVDGLRVNGDGMALCSESMSQVCPLPRLRAKMPQT